MKNTRAYFPVLMALLISVSSAQPPVKNPRIASMVSEVSQANLKAIAERLVSFGTRHSLSDTVSSHRGIGAARRWIASELSRYAAASGGRMSVGFHETVVPPSGRIPSPTNIVNVVATLRSRIYPDRILVIGGHYDSRAGNAMDSTSDAPGANDDGSGTAVVLELARIMAKHEFDATIVFIAFAAEEQGLLGAAAWAEMAAQKGWNVEAMFNNDIVGNSMGGDGIAEKQYVRLFSEAFSPQDTGSVFRFRNSLGLENDGPSRTLARWIDETAAVYVPAFDVKMVYRRDRFLRGGDHSAFHTKGFPAVRFSVARENYDWQHQNVRVEDGKQYGDLVQFMDFGYCANVARVNLAGLAALALAPAPVGGAGVVTSNLEYKTTLRWNRSAEPDLAGYFVRYRETTSPVWQHRQFVTDTTMTLNVLKDDHVFGVQGVDREGNAGLIVTPRPVR
ncbi:MAG: M20/M25/M40 family metallo-hydrolase [Bacteroidota bacterium]